MPGNDNRGANEKASGPAARLVAQFVSVRLS
jgi:hypothetical protein